MAHGEGELRKIRYCAVTEYGLDCCESSWCGFDVQLKPDGFKLRRTHGRTITSRVHYVGDLHSC